MSSNIITNSDYAINLNSGANTLTLTGLISITGNVSTGGNLTVANNAVINGNLLVSGNTTFINTNVITTNDKSITLANNQSTAANVDGAGIDIGVPTVAYWQFNNATTSWQTNINITPVSSNSLNLGGTANYWNAAYINSVSITTANVTGNITGGNILTGGLISATGNIIGNNISAGGLVSVVGNITSGNVSTTSLTGTTISASANIDAGNLLTSGLISATGNINAGNLTTTDLSGVTLTLSGNLNTTGNIRQTNSFAVISTSGNIAGGNLTIGSGFTGNISAIANIQGGNLLTGGLISAIGNITGGNVTTAGLTNTASLSVTGNTATVTTANYSIGYLNVPQVSLAANSIIALTDSGKHYYSTSASNLSLTIADNSSVAWPIGTAISIVNANTGNILINQGTGVSLYLAGNATAGNRVLATFGMATVMNTAANVWFINGTGLT